MIAGIKKKKGKSKPKCIDAFCGAGGLSFGTSSAGFNVLMVLITIVNVLENAENEPDQIRHAVERLDIAKLNHVRYRKSLGLEKSEIDLLAGGPPCQGFSSQGTIGSDEDPRSQLVLSYCQV